MPNVCVKIVVYGLVKFIFFLKPFLGTGCSFQLDWVKGGSQVFVQLNLGHQHAQCSPEGEGAVGRQVLPQVLLDLLRKVTSLLFCCCFASQCVTSGHDFFNGVPDLRQPSLVSLNLANFFILNYADSNLYKSVFCI